MPSETSPSIATPTRIDGLTLAEIREAVDFAKLRGWGAGREGAGVGGVRVETPEQTANRLLRRVAELEQRAGSIVLARLIEFPDDHTFMALAKAALNDADLPALCFVLGVVAELGGVRMGGKWGALASDVEAAVKARCQP